MSGKKNTTKTLRPVRLSEFQSAYKRYAIMKIMSVVCGLVELAAFAAMLGACGSYEVSNISTKDLVIRFAISLAVLFIADKLSVLFQDGRMGTAKHIQKLWQRQALWEETDTNSGHPAANGRIA